MRAANEFIAQLNQGHEMMITLAGAMSTAEIGRSLAEMIRQKKVHAICCTGANLEEDLFNAIAHDAYELVPNYRDLSPEDEQALLDRHYNRVTDTCIPEAEAFRAIEAEIFQLWQQASDAGESRLPHAYLYELILSDAIQAKFQIPKSDSWLLAAAEANLPVFVPGWEDSTLGNIFVAAHVRDGISLNCVMPGTAYMVSLIEWYRSRPSRVGFLQFGGGIAGDFPICVVPLLEQDLQEKTPLWSYFCQVTDATESYGGYSGAHPNEKITWGKLAVETPKFVINSDASIVAPLMFGVICDLESAGSHSNHFV